MRDYSYKLILCDLGNVLILFDHRIAARRIASFAESSMDDIYQVFFDSSFTKDFEEGRISPYDFFIALSKELRFKNLDFDAFVPIWNEIFFENRPMAALLERLKKDFRLHLVSNINELHYRYIEQNFSDHLSAFDGLYLSCRLKYRKPDAEIYRAAVFEQGYKFDQALYIDDRKDLIEEASKMGIRSVHFQGVAQLEKDLRELGVLF